MYGMYLNARKNKSRVLFAFGKYPIFYAKGYLFYPKGKCIYEYFSILNQVLCFLIFHLLEDLGI